MEYGEELILLPNRHGHLQDFRPYQELERLVDNTILYLWWYREDALMENEVNCAYSWLTPLHPRTNNANPAQLVHVWETMTGICRSVFEGPSPYIDLLTFSPGGSSLHTAGEKFPLPANLKLLDVEAHASHLFEKNQWVLRDAQRFLWLPFKYRGHSTAVYKDITSVPGQRKTQWAESYQ